MWITLIGMGISGLVSAQKVDFSWMVGSWKIETKDGMISESWQQVNDSTFIGESVFIVSSGERIPQESLELSLRKGEWAYTSKVNDQNNGQPVTFKLIFIGRQEFISENPQHDFPQRISYRKIGSQVFASIEGTSKGKYKKMNFDFEPASK